VLASFASLSSNASLGSLGSPTSAIPVASGSQPASSAPLSLLPPVEATPMNTPAVECEEAGA
jgi:hypothetical protein